MSTTELLGKIGIVPFKEGQELSGEGIVIDLNKGLKENLEAQGIYVTEKQAIQQYVKDAGEFLTQDLPNSTMGGGKRQQRRMKGGRPLAECRVIAITSILTWIASITTTAALGAIWLQLSNSECSNKGIEGLRDMIWDKYTGQCTSAATTTAKGMASSSTAITSIVVPSIMAYGKYFVPEFMINRWIHNMDGCTKEEIEISEKEIQEKKAEAEQKKKEAEQKKKGQQATKEGGKRRNKKTRKGRKGHKGRRSTTRRH